MRVGFIGIGNMGWPMAANIAKAGHAVTVHDGSAERMARFVAEHGGRAAETLADLGGCEFVVTMLPTGQIVREVLTGGAGGGLAPHLGAGTVVIDMSSSDPLGTQELGAALKARGIALVDAPVSGGVPRAAAGTLAIMIGGDDAEAIERARPLLRTMGDRLFDTGPLGSGHAMKALNNYCAAAAYAATAEALIIGERFGLAPETIVEIVNASTGRSFVSELVMKEHVVTGRFATGFQLGLLAKDVKIAADLGEALGIEAPVSRLVRERWSLARERVGAERDHSEAIRGWTQEPDRKG
ncbi:NAD(P)-dependent oxidoreductase [Arenibaculum pallidiluteum]|uniref:NAD(P)-dependent oxidoreductase n=1 Tax=Arenibaculum pallidiluteum TaxID=2812559 RepID=UPI001A96DF9A|nr:NAD(P)-dependent oxidoreductase [Arenibaculum pallidiluteum]